MITGELLQVEKKDRLGLITLNRGMARNALTSDMLRRLDAALCECGGDPETRVVIITGAGDFCAGADLKELAAMTVDTAEEFSRLGHAVFRRIETIPKAVIAAVAGHALGGGCELALACDIRLAGESALFGLPELGLGLIPGFGGTQRLASLLGWGRTREMILAGGVVSAREAGDIGLVTDVVADSELMERAMALADRMAGKSPAAVAAVKGLFLQGSGLARGLELEIAAFRGCFDSADREEGIAAFLEKRKPVFRTSE